VQEGLGGLDYVWVKEDLIDHGLDLGVLQELLKVIDFEAAE
jgi:hypothetical protein